MGKKIIKKERIKTPEREKHVFDATEKSLGRLASEIAVILMGKHKPTWEPHIDSGDAVVVQNIKYIKLTGKKIDQKIYYRNTGYPGGIRTDLARHLIKENPGKMLKTAVESMLPDNKLRRFMLARLTIE